MKSRFFVPLCFLVILSLAVFPVSPAIAQDGSPPVVPAAPGAATQSICPWVSKGGSDTGGQSADLSISKSASSASVSPGQTLIYTIQVSNNGPANATNIVANEVLSSKVTFEDANTSLGSYNSSSNQWTIPNLGSGSTAQLSLTVKVNPGQTGTIPNQVSVAGGQSDPTLGNNSASVSTSIVPPSNTVVSDDFNYYPNLKANLWAFVDPLGGSSVRTDGSHARIKVPGGASHSGANAPRISHTIQNTNFEMDVKFDSKPSGQFAIQGLMLEQDSNNFLRFEYFSDGVNPLYVYLSRVQNGTNTELLKTQVTGTITDWPMYLRVTRSGTNFTFWYSGNGTTWTQHLATTSSFNISKVSIHTGNSGGATAPAYESAIDYVFNTAAPINPEDPIHPSFLFSDDFSSGTLDTSKWTLVNPLGVEVLDFTPTQAKLSVPAGLEHDIWTGSQIFAPRLMQQTNNRNFEVEIKFDSMPQGTYTAQGFLVQQDDNDLLQYYLYSFETQLRIFASLVVNGVEQNSPYLIDTTVPTSCISGTPMYLRITRDGDWWVLTYGNGSTWCLAANFHSPLVSNQLGIVVGNEDHGDNGQVPAFTALIDYFQNTGMPLGPQD